MKPYWYCTNCQSEVDANRTEHCATCGHPLAYIETDEQIILTKSYEILNSLASKLHGWKEEANNKSVKHMGANHPDNHKTLGELAAYVKIINFIKKEMSNG